jgi:hypothetical protein
MTIIKNYFEVFLVTSKKTGEWHYRVKSWVIFNKGQFTHICQLNVSGGRGCGQDSISGIVLSPAKKKKTGRQNHALTQWKMLHCKTVVNIITYHHIV